MTAFKLMGFAGASPRVSKALLQDNEAQKATNTKLYSGELRSWYQPGNVAPRKQFGFEPQTIFRATTTAGDVLWMGWPNDVDVVRGPITDTQDFRVYYTGDGIPKKTNSTLAMTGSGDYPRDYLNLKVPAPTVAPTVSAIQPLGGVTITNDGDGYTSAPTVSFSSGAATAVASISGEIATLNITNAGSGFYRAPTVTISGGDGIAAYARATVAQNAGTISTSFSIVSGGSAYTSAPTITISGGGGSGAKATATITSGAVTAITLTDPGSGYTSAPTVTFSGGGGSGASATASVVTSGIQTLEIISKGAGFTAAPTVTFSGGGGTGATATASISARVVEIKVTNGGSYSTLPTVTLSGGGATTVATAEATFAPVETRAYIYTNISDFGGVEEESAPSSATQVTCSTTGATVTLSGFSAAPTGKYNITKRRIYRSVTGTSSTPYLFVKEIPIATTTTTDTVTATSLGEVCPSISWTPPPDDLKGLVSMPNGFLAGFRKNEIYFSAPYAPHAWPVEYTLTTDFDIVGLGVTGSTLVVATKGNPYVVNGIDPSAMSMEKLPLYEPCVSKRSIAADELGVYYVSQNGVILVGPGGAQNSTRNVFTRDEWSKYYPTLMNGEILDGRYYLFYSNGGTPKGGVIFDRYTQGSPFHTTTIYGSATFVEPTESILYIAENNEVRTWDLNNVNSLPYEWKSKLFTTERPLNFGVVQVDADFDNIARGEELQQMVAQMQVANQTLFASSGNALGGVFNAKTLNTYTMNGSLLQDVPQVVDDRYVLVTVIGNDEVRAQIQMNSTEPYRLPSDYMCDRWEFQINGNVPLRHVKIAETLKELRAV